MSKGRIKGATTWDCTGNGKVKEGKCWEKCAWTNRVVCVCNHQPTSVAAKQSSQKEEDALDTHTPSVYHTLHHQN